MRIPKLGDSPDYLRQNSGLMTDRVTMRRYYMNHRQHHNHLRHHRTPLSPFFHSVDSSSQYAATRSISLEHRNVFPDSRTNISWPCMADLETLQFDLVQSLVDSCAPFTVTACESIPRVAHQSSRTVLFRCDLCFRAY